MSAAPKTVLHAFVEAVVARDFVRARDQLHPEIDFRGMTPNRIWEASGPQEVEQALRTWIDNPERQVEHIAATDVTDIEDTMRAGWRVQGDGSGGPFVFEQQLYARERDGQLGWLRVMCTGPRPLGAEAARAVGGPRLRADDQHEPA
ncbi:MAG: hypothetical protein H0V81_00095 [Solirubrobacterales bacterium]|nr:hypothetical protein [Solirubrobacterales bacterium]